MSKARIRRAAAGAVISAAVAAGALSLTATAASAMQLPAAGRRGDDVAQRRPRLLTSGPLTVHDRVPIRFRRTGGEKEAE